LKLREKDKTADLPRVEMKIQGKGTVVLELFEDEAPETVATFISLAEAGFYARFTMNAKNLNADIIFAARFPLGPIRPNPTVADPSSRLCECLPPTLPTRTKPFLVV